MRTRKSAAVVVILLYSLFVFGCQQPVQNNNTEIISTQKLPHNVAGIWQASEAPWRITLSEDGVVSSVIIPMATTEIKPNQTTMFEMKDGQFSAIRAGDCIVEYDLQTRELYVSVDVNDMNIVFFEEQLTGHSQNYFMGKVSEDGKMWDASFMEVFDYGPRFPQDPNDIVAEPMLFEKVEKKKTQ